MRAQSSISPLALAVCCAVVAGALALAPARGTFPVGAGRGADVVALEGEAMNRDQQPTVADDGPDQDGVIDEVEVLGRMISRTESPEGDGVATCTEDCGDAQEPTTVLIGTTSDEVASRGTDGDDRPGTGGAGNDAAGSDGSGGDAPDPVSGATAAHGSTDGTTDRTDLDSSCRSPRAVAARNGGDADVVPASPCSQGRGHDPCGGPDCRDGRSSGTSEA